MTETTSLPVLFGKPRSWIPKLLTNDLRPYNPWMVKECKTGWWQLKCFWNFHPENWGRWTRFDEHIFQRGWNHQLENIYHWCLEFRGVFLLIMLEQCCLTYTCLQFLVCVLQCFNFVQTSSNEQIAPRNDGWKTILSFWCAAFFYGPFLLNC